jgi:DNA-binding CsgD family transcriptional regulator
VAKPLGDEMEPLDEITRLLALLLRRQCETQTQFIVEMSSAGFPNSRIAQFAGTTTDTVGATLRGQKHRSTSKKPKTPTP